MRFPDLEAVVAAAVTTFRRFPATLISALAACGMAMVLIDYSGHDEPLVRALLAAILGIGAMFAVESGSERRGGKSFRGAGTVVVTLALVGFAVFSGRWSDEHQAERFAQLLLAFHLIAAFAAFAGTQEENGFWQFNKTLFMRFWTSTLFAGVLFAGLAIALRSIEALFGVNIDGENYGRLFVFMALAVHPWMFLSGVPKELESLEQEREYPPALKVFAQFILVPLVTVYLLILTAYLVRVIATQEWPSGWIGWLVSSVSVVGTLALLLVHPVRGDEGNGWVRGYARWFWVALMPSIAMLFFAIGKRISQYGFTERRYFLLVLAVWIAVVAVWFAITRSRRIRFIPVSLAVVALVTFFGPWGAYSVSRRSQVARLTTILADAGATTFPVAEGTSLTTDPDAARQVSDILRYLYGTHSVDDVRAVVEVPLEADTMTDHPGRGNSQYLARLTVESLGMRYFDQWETAANTFVNVYSDGEVWPAPTEVYRHVFRVYATADGAPVTVVEGDSIGVIADSVSTALNVTVNGMMALSLPLGELFDGLGGADTPGQNSLAPERLVFTAISDRIRVRAHIRNVNGRMDGPTVRLQSAEMDLYVTLIEAPPP